MGNKKRSRLSTQIEEASVDDLFKEYNKLAEELLRRKIDSAFAHRAYSEKEAAHRFVSKDKDVLMSRINHQRQLLKPFTESAEEKGIVIEFHGSETYTHKFAALFSAQTFVEEVINERPFKWQDSRTIQVGSLIIRADKLEEIIEYEPTRKEREWELPKDSMKFAKRIRETTGIRPKTTSPDEATIKVKSSPDGTTIAQLCAQLKLEPRIARGILRKNKIAKPYAWKDPASIIKLLKGA